MSYQIDHARVVRTAEKIQRKFFRGMWNYEVMAVCCILLADEVAEAEGVDREKMLGDLVKTVKKYINLKQEGTRQ
jgi:hypothetical protein